MRLKHKQSVMLLRCSAHRNISVDNIATIVYIQYVCVLYVCIGVYLCTCMYVGVCVTLDRLDDTVENFKDSKDD